MKKYLFYTLFFICFSGWTQNEASEPENAVHLLARAQENKILLRWAPSKPILWLKGNEFGYQIEKYTIYRDGQRLATPEKDVLTNTPLKPDPIETWEEMVDESDYAAIIAQSLYGESFEVEGMDNESGIMQIVNKAQEIEQRFSFALFAADMNFEAAKKAALGFEDTNVKANEKYFYRVIMNIPEETMKVQEGSVYIDIESREPLPAPIDLLAIGGDKNIMLTWEYEMFKSIYTSYFVERSPDGKNFSRLGDTPLVNLNDRPEAPAKRMYYVDTLAQNDKTYHYRVVGISAFGEEGQYSEVVSASGQKDLGFTPHISDYRHTPQGGALIKWEFPKEGEPEIIEFQLNRSSNAKGPFETVKTGIPPAQREVLYDKLSPSNYFTITALGKNNQKMTSFAAFVQTIDSIPPNQPIGLNGKIDSLGVVTLQWDKNLEEDMLGYRVFRGNIETEEVSQLTVDPIEHTVFIDTVQLKSLNSKVFYQVVAVDQRFNMSPYSEKLALKKPDVVPPSSPVFSGYNVNNGVVSLQWVNSQSEDVIHHKLYRQNISESENGWELIFETDTISMFQDNKVLSGNKYRYAIFAEDESKLKSDPSTPITLTIKSFDEKQGIKGLGATPDRINMSIELFWRKPADDIAEVLIYRSKGEEKPVLFKQIPASVTKMTDTKVSPNNYYKYHVKPVLKQGGYANIETIEVKF